MVWITARYRVFATRSEQARKNCALRLTPRRAVDVRAWSASATRVSCVAEDSSNDASLPVRARLDSLRVRIGEAFSFLRLEIQAIA